MKRKEPPSNTLQKRNVSPASLAKDLQLFVARFLGESKLSPVALLQLRQAKQNCCFPFVNPICSHHAMFTIKNCRHLLYEVRFFSLEKKRTSLKHPPEKKRIARFIGKRFTIVCFPLTWRKQAVAGCPATTAPTKAKLLFPIVNLICSHHARII